MKTALIALTKRGAECAKTYAAALPLEGDIYIHESASFAYPQARRFASLREIMPDLWANYRLLVFIMAAGIVIRQAAPFLQGKERDPAVLAGDEAGRFIIPLLSGHLGGANAWAEFLAERTGARAVLTTATDVNGLVAPDEYARRLGWKVEPLGNLKKVNRNFLERGHLTVWSAEPLPEAHPLRRDPRYIYLGRYPEGESSTQPEDENTSIFPAQARRQADILVGIWREELRNEEGIRLIPPLLSAGVGCRRGVGAGLIMEGLENALLKINSSPSALKGLYSIDRKADEEGLRQAARLLGVPFVTYPAEEIQSVNEQYKLNQSAFVRKEIGVDGVCEAASLLGANKGELLLSKHKEKGLTIAISREKFISSESAPEIPNI